MNEFEGKPLELLKHIRINLRSYLQGVQDTRKLMDEIWEKTIELYNQKIHLCDMEIEWQEGKQA